MVHQLRSDSLWLSEHTSRLHVFGKYTVLPHVFLTYDWYEHWSPIGDRLIIFLDQFLKYFVICHCIHGNSFPFSIAWPFTDSASHHHLTCGCFYLCHVFLLFFCRSLSLLPFPSIVSLCNLFDFIQAYWGEGYMWHHLTWTVPSRCGHVKSNTKFDLLWVWPWCVIMSWFLCALCQALVSWKFC